MPGKLYVRFSFFAMGILLLALIAMSAAGRSVYYVGVETMLLFALVYFTVVVIVMYSISPYKQEFNLFAGIIPALMILLGVVIATYFWSLHLDPDFGAILYATPILVALILPISAALLSHSTGIRAWKLYISSTALIILAALITLWFYSGY
ncbi:MAG: hypothetical protein WC467_00895 [Patescibacteria group bacterium]